MLGFFTEILEHVSDERVAADHARAQAQRARNAERDVEVDVEVEDVDDTEDYQPSGRASRARDAFRRA